MRLDYSSTVKWGSTLFFFVRGALLLGVEDTARNRALEADHIIESGEDLDEEDIEELTSEGVFLLIRDGDGGILRTINLPAQAEDLDTVWQQALQSGRPEDDTTETSDNGPVYLYVVPVDPAAGSSARVVEAGQSYEGVYRTLQTFATVLVFVILGAFLLSVGGAYLLARAALSPVGAVVASARKITESDLSERLPLTNPKDEIGSLAVTMNDLLSRLEAAFARREEALKRQEEALSHQRRFVADASHELRIFVKTS